MSTVRPANDYLPCPLDVFTPSRQNPLAPVLAHLYHWVESVGSRYRPCRSLKKKEKLRNDCIWTVKKQLKMPERIEPEATKTIKKQQNELKLKNQKQMINRE
jgi:hypothetical protein